MIEPDAVDPHEIQTVTHHPKDRVCLQLVTSERVVPKWSG
jgi:hypothetical protein